MFNFCFEEIPQKHVDLRFQKEKTPKCIICIISPREINKKVKISISGFQIKKTTDFQQKYEFSPEKMRKTGFDKF